MIYLDGAMSLTVEAGEPRFVVAVWEWKAFLGAEAKERGIRAILLPSRGCIRTS